MTHDSEGGNIQSDLNARCTHITTYGDAGLSFWQGNYPVHKTFV